MDHFNPTLEEKEVYLVLAGWSCLQRDGCNWWMKREVDLYWNYTDIAYKMEMKLHD